MRVSWGIIHLLQYTCFDVAAIFFAYYLVQNDRLITLDIIGNW